MLTFDETRVWPPLSLNFTHRSFSLSFEFFRVFVKDTHPPPFGLRARTENFSGRLIKKLNPRSRRVLRARFTKVAVEVRLRSYVAFERERERESRERFLHLFRPPPRVKNVRIQIDTRRRYSASRSWCIDLKKLESCRSSLCVVSVE